MGQFGTLGKALRCRQKDRTELPALNACAVSRNAVQAQEGCCQLRSVFVCTEKSVATAAVAPRPWGNFVQHTGTSSQLRADRQLNTNNHNINNSDTVPHKLLHRNCQTKKKQAMISYKKNKPLRYSNQRFCLSVALQIRVNISSINPISTTIDMCLDTVGHVTFCQSTVQFSMSVPSSPPQYLHSQPRIQYSSVSPQVLNAQNAH